MVVMVGSPSPTSLTAMTVITYVTPCSMLLMVKVVWLDNFIPALTSDDLLLLYTVYVNPFTGGAQWERSDSWT